MAKSPVTQVKAYAADNWWTVVTALLLFAFFLYILSNGSLPKYKTYLGM